MYAFILLLGESSIANSGFNFSIISIDLSASSQLRFESSENKALSISFGETIIILWALAIFIILENKAVLCFGVNSFESLTFIFFSFGSFFSFIRAPAITRGPMTGPYDELTKVKLSASLIDSAN